MSAHRFPLHPAYLASTFALVGVLFGCNQPDVVAHHSDWTGGGENDADTTKLAFDPATLRTMVGTVTKLEPYQRMAGTRAGLRVTLVTDDERFYVYLAPLTYLGRAGMVLEPQTELRVTGSVVGGEGRRVIIATEISKNGRTVVLRDSAGRPAWQSWRGLGRT